MKKKKKKWIPPDNFFQLKQELWFGKKTKPQKVNDESKVDKFNSPELNNPQPSF